MMHKQVGIQRRMDGIVIGHDEPNHIQFDSQTTRGRIDNDSHPGPKSLFEHELSDDIHRLFKDRDYRYAMRIKDGGGERTPEYLREKKELLTQLGLLQEAMSVYPYIAVVPNGLIRDNQYEIAQEFLEEPEQIVINGKQYQVQRQKLAESLAKGQPAVIQDPVTNPSIRGKRL